MIKNKSIKQIGSKPNLNHDIELYLDRHDKKIKKNETPKREKRVGRLKNFFVYKNQSDFEEPQLEQRITVLNN